jgi:hypothetical protein
MCDNFLYVFKGARSAPRAVWRVIPRGGRPDGRGDGRACSACGHDAPAGFSPHLGWPLPPLHLRHTAGGRPCVTPGTAHHQLAAVTPAEHAHAGTAILPALQL